MKNNRLNFRPAVLFLITTIIGTGSFLIGCEPETDELPFAEMQTTLNMESKSSTSTTLNKELAALRAYVAPYHNYDTAVADGYIIDITGYRSMMGHHYLKPGYLDENFDLLQPELLIYVPGSNGKMRLVGVEYATVIEDLNNPPPAPEGFTGHDDVWAINTEFSVWTLHVWVGLNNPNGIFAMRNPRLP